MRFVQVSCLGSSASSPSRFLKAKAAAEEAVLRELPEVELSCFMLLELITFIFIVSPVLCFTLEDVLEY